MQIIDRRLNPGGKSLANRQRFIRRAKSLIRKAVHESTASRTGGLFPGGPLASCSFAAAP